MALAPAEIAHGPMLIGTFLNVALWGICVVQVYLYYNSPRKDNIWVKTFIYLLFLADTLHTLFTVIFMYRALVVNFGNFESLATADWIAATDPAITGIIGGGVQIFYVRRLKILTRNWILVATVLVCAFASILMGIASGAAVHFVPHYVEFRKFKVVVIIWLVSAAVADVLITFSLVSYLNKQRTGFSKTNNYIDKIVRLTIQTGLLTAVWAIVDLSLFLANPTGLHLIFNFSLSKLYSNSLMSSLNARDFWKYDTTKDTSTQLDTIPGLATSVGNITQLSTIGGGNGRQNTEVFVHVERTRTSMDPSKVTLPEDYDKEIDDDHKTQAFEKV